jgi:mono/diheme cytochrome c family protein
MFLPVITALAFIITFIVVGLVVVAAAFSGGRRNRERPPGPTRRNRRGVFVFTGIVVVLLGVLVPALVIASAKDATSAPGGLTLDSAAEHGRVVFAERCATCHTLKGANAVGKVGPNLDQLVGPLDPNGVGGTKQQQAFVLGAIRQGRANGRGQMPANLVDGEDAQDVAKFVAVVAGH